MTKIKKFGIVDRCLVYTAKDGRKILVVGDLHLGYENYLMEKGWSFPKTQWEETKDIFERIFKKIEKVDEIILLGDVKHHFGGILREEFSDFHKLIDLLRSRLKSFGKIIITKGNHDSILEPIVRNYDVVELKEVYVVDDVLFFHGDNSRTKKMFKQNLSLFDEKIKEIVLGHYHPAVTLEEKGGAKKEKYKCFLFGNSKKYGDMIFVPSFFPLVEGSDYKKDINWNFDFDVKKVFILSGKFGEFYEFKS